MLLRRFIKEKEKRRRIAHIVAGFVIFVHAYEKYETGHGSYVFFTIAGSIFLLVAVMHPMIEKKVPWVDGVFFVIEGILSFVIAYDAFHVGKKALPFAYILVGIFQFVVAIMRGRKGIHHHRQNNITQDDVVNVAEE